MGGEPFEVKIDPERINTMVAQAIMGSAIGAKLQEIVTKAVADVGGYNSPLKAAIEAEVMRLIMDTVKTQYLEQVRTAVKAKMTEEAITQIVDAAWAAIVEKTKSRY